MNDREHALHCSTQVLAVHDQRLAAVIEELSKLEMGQRLECMSRLMALGRERDFGAAIARQPDGVQEWVRRIFFLGVGDVIESLFQRDAEEASE